MTVTEVEVHGPVDYLLLEFRENRLTGGAAAAMLDLVDRGVIAVYDILVVGKDQQGSAYSLDLAEAGAETGDFAGLAGARSGLLDDDDLADAASAMEPGTLAVLIVYENLWAIPFVAAAMESGAELIASARIPAADLLAAVEALEARKPAGSMS
jgi:Family of unknown function (DUF6325)